MGTTSQKIQYLGETKSLIKDSINLTGAGITNNDTFRSYAVKLKDSLLNVLNNGTIVLYNNFPKVSGTGSNISLSNTLEAPMFMNKFDGDTLQQQIVPSEYTQVDYIDNTGVEYIDTGVIGKKNIKVYMELSMKSLPSGNHPVSGCYGNNQRCYLGIINSSGLLGYSYNTTTWSSRSISINQKNIIEIDFKQNSQSMKLNGTSILTTTSSVDLNTNQNILLFGYNNDGEFDTRFPILYKLYRYKIYEGNTLVRDFVPCYRNSDNEIGMYDIVNNVFYTNQGTGTFTYGTIVPSPDSPLEIQSVEQRQNIIISDGTNSNNYEVNLGKNLLDIASNSITNRGVKLSINNTNLKINGTATQNYPIDTNTMPLILNTPIPAGTYVFSVSGTYDGTANHEISYQFYDANNNKVGDLQNIGTNSGVLYGVITTTTPITKITYLRNMLTGATVDFDLYLQLERGTTPTSYTPYMTPIKLYNGDYITGTPYNWSIVRNWKEVILNGSESINYYSVTQGSLFRFYNVMIDESSDTTYTPLSNYYQGLPYSQQSSRSNNHFYIKQSEHELDIIDNRYTSADDYKTWLSSNNVKILYKLATPTTTPITDTYLISQLNALYNAKSKNGQTNITVSGNLPMILEVSALKDEI